MLIAPSLSILFYKADIPLTAQEYNCNISAGGCEVCAPHCVFLGLTGKGRS